MHADKPKGVNAANLSNILRFDLKATDQNLIVTTQNSTNTNNPNLLRNYGTNNRMLRYKQIQE